MGANTKIEWADHTLNFWWGCEKVSPGCANCYAASQSHRLGEDIWGYGKPRKWIKSAAANARRWNEQAQREGVRYRVFCQSMSDFFEEDHQQPIVDHHGLRLAINEAGDVWPYDMPSCRQETRWTSP